MSFLPSVPMVVRCFVHWIGTKPSTLQGRWPRSVTGIVDEVMAGDSSIAQAEIKGSEPHMSHNDLSDPEPVISIRLFDENGKRITTLHAHEDGTYTTPISKKKK